jgi:hypothetical protein
MTSDRDRQASALLAAPLTLLTKAIVVYSEPDARSLSSSLAGASDADRASRSQHQD